MGRFHATFSVSFERTHAFAPEKHSVTHEVKLARGTSQRISTTARLLSNLTLINLRAKMEKTYIRE